MPVDCKCNLINSLIFGVVDHHWCYVKPLGTTFSNVVVLQMLVCACCIPFSPHQYAWSKRQVFFPIAFCTLLEKLSFFDEKMLWWRIRFQAFLLVCIIAWDLSVHTCIQLWSFLCFFQWCICFWRRWSRRRLSCDSLGLLKVVEIVTITHHELQWWWWELWILQKLLIWIVRNVFWKISLGLRVLSL